MPLTDAGLAARAVRLAGVAVGGVAVALLLTACGQDVALSPGDPGTTAVPGTTVEPVVDTGDTSAAVIPSAAYAAAVGDAAQAERIAAIAATVDALRAASTSGWQARQDDTTGWADELSGGRWTGSGDPVAAARQFVDDFGAAFGPGAQFAYEPAAYDDSGVATVRASQVVGDVPVDGGQLVVPVTSAGGGGQISYVSGLVYDVTGVATSPTVSAQQALRAVRAAVGSEPDADPSLVVYTGAEEPRLAWAVVVLAVPQGDSDGDSGPVTVTEDPSTFFVDATDGTILGSRVLGTTPQLARGAAAVTATQPDLGNYNFRLPQRGKAVIVTGTLPDGTKGQINAEQLPDGSIVMVDATAPGANRSTGKGLIVVTDGSGLDGTTNEVGPVVRSRNGRIPADAFMAMYSARHVVDYFREELGRQSFDGRNSPIVAVTNSTYGEPCLDNASFLTAPGSSTMFIGVPCEGPDGPSVNTFADLFIVGHEITHGVTHTNVNEFAYNNTQQGAIDEGTSDYFGVIIENGVLGKVGTTGTHFACYERESIPFCAPQSAGQRGLRDVNSGAIYDDYAFTLADPFGLASEIGDDGHQNSLIWTNALWKTRIRLAALDGGDMLTSQRAKQFDRAVHRATTTYLTMDSDLVTAAEAVQRAAAEVGLGAEEQLIVKDQFRVSKICRGCTVPLALPAYVAASSRVKVRPAVAGSRVVYTQYDGPIRSRTMAATPGATDQRAVGTAGALALRNAAAGDWVAETVVQFSARGESYAVVLANLATGKTAVLSDRVDPRVGPAVSDQGVAWAEGDGSVVAYRTLSGGSPTRIRVASPVAHLATDGGRVAIQEEDGTLSVWDVQTGQRQAIDTVDWARAGRLLIAGGGVAMSGNRIAVLEEPLGLGRVLVYDLAARTKTTLSEQASPFGITIDGDTVVWAEATGPLPGRVNQLTGNRFVDTELRGYSFATGKTYEMADPRGQQGFPSLSGNVLAWQDTAGGGNDIIALTITPPR